MTQEKQKRVFIGALAGGAIGLFQLRAQHYNFSNSEDVSQAIGFMLGFVGFGALIGWISGPKEPEAQ